MARERDEKISQRWAEAGMGPEQSESIDPFDDPPAAEPTLPHEEVRMEDAADEGMVVPPSPGNGTNVEQLQVVTRPPMQKFSSDDEN